jgi:hypothetical protein
MADGDPSNAACVALLAFRLETLCAELRVTVPLGLRPGTGTLQALRLLRREWASLVGEAAVADLPTINHALSPADVLAVAGALRSRVLSALTPEQLEDHRRTFGPRGA